MTRMRFVYFLIFFVALIGILWEFGLLVSLIPNRFMIDYCLSENRINDILKADYKIEQGPRFKLPNGKIITGWEIYGACQPILDRNDEKIKTVLKNQLVFYEIKIYAMKKVLLNKGVSAREIKQLEATAPMKGFTGTKPADGNPGTAYHFKE
jgi:hypothetical protein